MIPKPTESDLKLNADESYIVNGPHPDNPWIERSNAWIRRAVAAEAERDTARYTVELAGQLADAQAAAAAMRQALERAKGSGRLEDAEQASEVEGALRHRSRRG